MEEYQTAAPAAPDEGSAGFENELDPAPYGIFDRNALASDTAEDRATAVAVMTDPELLREFLACAANHPGLGLRGCLEAVRCGKASALVLLPASGQGSWDTRGKDVKAGCTSLRVTVGTGGRRPTQAALYSEYDLTVPADDALDLGDYPPNLLTPASEEGTEAFNSAYATLPATPRYVRHALALRHGLEVSDAALGCPDVISPDEAYVSLRDVATYVADVRDAFDEALTSAVAGMGGQPDEDAFAAGDGQDQVAQEPSYASDAVACAGHSPVAAPDAAAPSAGRPEAGATHGGPTARDRRSPAPTDTSDLSPDDLIARIASEIRD